MKPLASFFTFIILSCHALAQLNLPFSYFTLSVNNDSWGGGFTEIRDDQRTVGITADYQFLALDRANQFRTTYSVLTNRFASPDSGRIDELEFYLRIPVWRFEDKITLSAIGGAIVAGDLGGQQFQNKVHSSVGVGEFNLPYPDKTRGFGFVGGSLWLNKILTYWGYESYFNISSQIEYYWAPGYKNFLSAGIGPTVSNTKNNRIALLFGFDNTNAFYDNAVLQSVANTESGFFIEYAMRLGIANFGFKTLPGNNFTNGYLGITLLNKSNFKKLETVDVTAEIGALGNDKGIFIRYLWNQAGADKNNWLLDFHYQFWTFGTDELLKKGFDLGHYQQFSLGVNYNFVKPKNALQILPYISGRAGYKIDSYYNKPVSSVKERNANFILIGEAGFRLKLPAKIDKNNCFYGVTPSYQYVFEPGSDPNSFGYFGLAAFVMVDF